MNTVLSFSFRKYCARNWTTGLVLVLIHAGLIAGRAVAEEITVQSSILYETPDGFYIDVGSDDGVWVGLIATIERGGNEVARAKVLRVSPNSALLSVLGSEKPRPGDSVRLVTTPPPARSEGRDDVSRTVKESRGKEKAHEFVPLLAPTERSMGLTTDNVFHGALRLRQQMHIDPDNQREYYQTRIGSNGGLERIKGTPWAFEWGFDLTYRDGDAFQFAEGYQEVKLYLHRAAFYRKFDDTSTVRVGRFIPRELASVGYLDGVQAEKALSENLRVGAMTGFKPRRADLEFSGKEPMVVPYATYGLGDPNGVSYVITTGILASLYEGEADRLALLVDQSFHITPRLSLLASAEVDLDVNMEYRDGVRLTRFDLFASYAATPWLSLRAGIDHYELLDTAAEREAIDFEQPDFFDDGYWRHSVGATLRLPWNLHISGEAWYSHSDVDDFFRYSGSITRTGLPFMPGGSITVSAYNLEGGGITGSEGYGGNLSLHLPFFNYRLSIDPSVSVRLVDTDPDFELGVVDYSVRATWTFSRNWNMYAGITYFNGTGFETYLADLGVTYRW